MCYTVYNTLIYILIRKSNFILMCFEDHSSEPGGIYRGEEFFYMYIGLLP